MTNDGSSEMRKKYLPKFTAYVSANYEHGIQFLVTSKYSLLLSLRNSFLKKTLKQNTHKIIHLPDGLFFAIGQYSCYIFRH